LRALAPEPVVSALKAGRDLVDSCLHPIRRRRALRVVEEMEPDANILVLCWGNICRSPFAAELIANATEQDGAARWRVISAGFLAAKRPSPDAAIEVAREWGVDLSNHRSITVSDPSVREADLILVMDEPQRDRLRRSFAQVDSPVIVMSDLELRAVPPRGIPDPVDQPHEVFRKVYSRISDVVETIASLDR